jgi:hypothetical protein
MENTIPPIAFNNEKIFVAPNPKGKTIRRAMELLDKYSDEKISDRDVNILVAFLCDVYGGKFSINDVYDGMPPEDILAKTFGCAKAIVQMLVDASKVGSGSGGGKPVKPIEALRKLYKEIIKQGWTMPDLDESDFFALMDILIEPEETHYINEIF